MMTIVLPYTIFALLAGFVAGWYFTRKKADRQLNAASLHATLLEDQLATVQKQLTNELEEKAILATRLFQSEQQEKELKEALTQITQEKVVFSTDLQAAWKIHTDLKARYDALYLKNIEVTNEKNRLKRQIPPGQTP